MSNSNIFGVGMLMGGGIVAISLIIASAYSWYSHKEKYLCIEKIEIVKQGYAEWSYDKKFMIKPNYLKYYELKSK
jgi:hypothetical protein